MNNYDRCGLFRCGSFRTSIPSNATGKTKFMAYLRSIGHPDGEGLGLKGKPGIYTIMEASKNQNTEVQVDGDFETILVGVRKNYDRWDVYALDKSVIENKDRGVISLNTIRNKASKIYV